jgi:hypothetical protein
MNIKIPIIAALLLILVGCNPYKRISLTGGEFYGRNKVIKNLDDYDVYVHDADSVYQIADPIITENSEISGEVIEVQNKKAALIKASDTTAVKLVNEQDDIHIYLDEGETIKPESLKLPESSIDSVILSGKEKKGALGVALTILLACLVLSTILFLVLVFALLSASGDSTSDSGDSGSGGSDSDSGCYIATMAYGSYEAPEVLVLRKFRDQFLDKFAWGRAFIQWYYRTSPAFVKKHESKKWLHITLRKMLSGFVFVLKPFFK